MRIAPRFRWVIGFEYIWGSGVRVIKFFVFGFRG